MARIVYGVCGTGRGHAIRALTVIRRFPQHQFLAVSHEPNLSILRCHVPAVEVPNPSTPVRGHRMLLAASVGVTLSVLAAAPRHRRTLQTHWREFRPELAISDYEYFVPRLSREAAVPCLSLDNQHVISACRLQTPPGQLPGLLANRFSQRLLYNRADHYLAVSFFQPPLKPGSRMRVLPALLREEVRQVRPSRESHILAYQGYPTFPDFFELLAGIKRPVRIYGCGEHGSRGNLDFRPFSEEEFLEDLASCAYVVCGGGHTLISEALHLGKPVLSFPIAGAFEQWLNAHYLELNGWGMSHPGQRPRPGLMAHFESRLPEYRSNLACGSFCGNGRIFAHLEHFFAHGALPSMSTDGIAHKV